MDERSIFGLVGNPLGHSLSKPIHEALGAYDYHIMPMEPPALDAFLRRRDFSGINVTIPYKQTVIPYCDELSPNALAIGAVNTIVNKNGVLTGYNTDFDGLSYLIRSSGINIKGESVLILGTGGTSKTAFAVAQSMGAKSICFAGRQGGDNALTYEQAQQRRDISVIINASPAGMFPSIDTCLIQPGRFPALRGVIDVVYNPLNTELALRSREGGITAVCGLKMLVAQACFAAELFTGSTVSTQKMDEIYRKTASDMGSLVFIGMPGSGKSSLGKLTAQALSRPFIDLDLELARRLNMSVADIFALHGEGRFRELEAELCAELAPQRGAVIATGGGVPKSAKNMHALGHNGLFIWVKRDSALLDTEGRPLSGEPCKMRELERERLPLYEKYADFSVWNNGDIEDALSQILAFYKGGCK